jgi:hypothetical protein
MNRFGKFVHKALVFENFYSRKLGTSYFMELPEETQQPWLPRVRMIWYFVAVAVVAFALGIIQAADQGQALAAAFVFTILFIAVFALFASGCFLFTYFFGFLEKTLGDAPTLANPFADGQLPDQLVPPRPTEIH